MASKPVPVLESNFKCKNTCTCTRYINMYTILNGVLNTQLLQYTCIYLSIIIYLVFIFSMAMSL